MKDISWELKNLDSIKEYIFEELIVDSIYIKDIDEAINLYAERYHDKPTTKTKAMNYYCKQCLKVTPHQPKLNLEMNGQAKCSVCETINDKD